jgi:hypothetical protein
MQRGTHEGQGMAAAAPVHANQKVGQRHHVADGLYAVRVETLDRARDIRRYEPQVPTPPSQQQPQQRLALRQQVATAGAHSIFGFDACKRVGSTLSDDG